MSRGRRSFLVALACISIAPVGCHKGELKGDGELKGGESGEAQVHLFFCRSRDHYVTNCDIDLGDGNAPTHWSVRAYEHDSNKESWRFDSNNNDRDNPVKFKTEVGNYRLRAYLFYGPAETPMNVAGYEGGGNSLKMTFEANGHQVWARIEFAPEDRPPR